PSPTPTPVPYTTLFRSHHLCQTALSVPIAKRSSRFDPHETGVTGEITAPPSDSQPPQCAPSHHLCQTAESRPTPKMSKRFGPQADRKSTRLNSSHGSIS